MGQEKTPHNPVEAKPEQIRIMGQERIIFFARGYSAPAARACAGARHSARRPVGLASLRSGGGCRQCRCVRARRVWVTAHNPAKAKPEQIRIMGLEKNVFLARGYSAPSARACAGARHAARRPVGLASLRSVSGCRHRRCVRARRLWVTAHNPAKAKPEQIGLWARKRTIFRARGYSSLRSGLRGRALARRRPFGLASLRSVGRYHQRRCVCARRL